MSMPPWIARAVIFAVLWQGTITVREANPPPLATAATNAVQSTDGADEVIRQPPGEDNLACLLRSDDARIHLEFGYRGCFGGSDNDLDLDVGTTAMVNAHRWTGVSTRKVLTRQQGQEYLQLFVDALVKPDEANEAWSTTKAYVRVSFWCGCHRSGPFVLETHAPSAADQRAFERALKGRLVPATRHHPYSCVHGTIAVAQELLASVGR
jgi:hypothetical protein